MAADSDAKARAGSEWNAIVEAGTRDEREAVQALLAEAPFGDAARRRIMANARALVAGCRRRSGERSLLDLFLQEFGLSNEEGIALMCISEALLRIPDDATAEALIAEKIASADWAAHVGESESLFLNASTWALLLTGKVLGPANRLEDAVANDLGGWINRLAARLGEPVVRTAMSRAVRILGAEFVLGRTIGEALRRGDGALASFDMLGEGARTHADARRYAETYRNAIEAIGHAFPDADPAGSSGVSVKLSALHPRFEPLQEKRVMAELGETLLDLASAAAARNLHLTIDAEEAERLELTLRLMQQLANEPRLRDWQGLGIAVQAYSKRAPAVIDWLDALRRPIMVRLVKGAYWDHEIKRAQVQGLSGYPVYTRKAFTDLAYLRCAAQLFASPHIYPQFATHNAYTLAAVMELGAKRREPFEFQRLHGMGELLYDEARRQHPGLPPVRVYAPVGAHKDLLAYLVRRLLENGANSSFVNRFLDAKVPVDELLREPMAAVEACEARPHPGIPLPRDLFGRERLNSAGLDIGDSAAVRKLLRQAGAHGEPAIAIAENDNDGTPANTGEAGAALDRRKRNGQTDRVAGRSEDEFPRRESRDSFQEMTATDAERLVRRAAEAFPRWEATPAEERAGCLLRLADLLEGERPRFVSLLRREAGKTLLDAVAEVREAADFCRYYANECTRLFGAPQPLPGPTGEANSLALRGRGVFACISPWNFPLAIFTGQVTAALAAGNTAVAKPAPQTPHIAAAAVDLMHAAGIPEDAVRLAIGGVDIGRAMVADEAIAGVAFTGSTDTAKHIQRALAARTGPIVPLIAETGGQNAMVVDSTALPEQVVDDAIASAFGSAGQRCSALRVLHVQEDIAEALIAMLAGAMDTLVIGDPSDPATDVGPVIDREALARLETHIGAMKARVLHRCRLPSGLRGTFCPPVLIGIESIAELEKEHFGPILHVVRYARKRLPAALAEIRASGYGLTLGIHTRIHSRAEAIMAAAPVGNCYVNRDMVGAVVGVQPFGGEGLSGTGPKAGGPHYLPAFAVERTLTWNTVATGGNAALLNLDDAASRR